MLPPLKKRDIINYSIGDFGINLNFQLIGFFLAYFYTDVFGISPGHVAGLLLAARAWDAINDPVMGFIADKTRTKWGRFRPYVFFGAIPLNLMLVACFYVPDLSVELKVLYAYVTYILHGMVFTAVGLPYSSISAVMTQDQQERSLISTLRMFFAVIIAMSIVNIGTRPFISRFYPESEADGFFALAVIYAIISSAVLIYVGIKSKERLDFEPERYRLTDISKIIFSNKMLLILGSAMFFNTCIWVIANSVALYYFKYILGNTDLYSVFFWYMLPANVLGVISTPILTKIYGKRNVFILGSAIVVVANLVRHFLPGDEFATFTAISMLASMAMMFCSCCQWGMVPDTVEYGHWKSGIRSEGIPFAFFSFAFKAGMALGGSFSMIVLEKTGYIANSELNEASRTAVIWLYNIVPAGCSVACIIALIFYKLDGERFSQILADLEARTRREA
jgi:sugar (glycoside-pentoside-hexuronide) transporter